MTNNHTHEEGGASEEEFYPVDTRPIPPQDYLIEELNTREWSEERFSKESGLLPFEVTEILNCSRPIRTNEAVKIAKAFGTSAELWLGLQVEFYWEMLRKQCGELAEARAVQTLAEEFREVLRTEAVKPKETP